MNINISKQFEIKFNKPYSSLKAKFGGGITTNDNCDHYVDSEGNNYIYDYTIMNWKTTDTKSKIYSPLLGTYINK
jgi:hypothetical protein